jgi:glycosyltransferase involved in cell wall biosynthesis
LFEQLKDVLARKNVELRVLVGTPSPSERAKNDSGTLDWAERVESKYWAGERICWQRFGPAVRKTDLVIVTQEMRLLYNFVPMFGPRRYKLAYWGHGRNFQAADKRSLVEQVKRRLITPVDWWFAYTALSAELVTEAGFPASRITCLNNSVDTDSFKQQLKSVDSNVLSHLRATHCIPTSSPVGLYCGSLYTEKRITLLLQAAVQLRELQPDFHLVILGAGSDAVQVRQAAQRHSWIHYVGALHGSDRASYFRMADLFINPGMIGLAIIDAFCAGLPVVTTSSALHSPEIAYLEPGRNGVFASDTPIGFARDAAALLSDRTSLQKMAAYASSCADRYSLSAMVDHFAEGILQCLSDPERPLPHLLTVHDSREQT